MKNIKENFSRWLKSKVRKLEVQHKVERSDLSAHELRKAREELVAWKLDQEAKAFLRNPRF